jgi:hypothetical protein
MEMLVQWEGERAPFAKAFVAAQKATEAVKKASTNPAFKSRYADLAACVEAVVPALNAEGIGVLQFPSFDGESAGVTTTLLHEGGSSVTATLHLRPTKADPQGVGSALTYARRYSLLAIVGAAPEDDDGNTASEAGATGKPFSSYAAKKAGLGPRATALKHEIDALASLDECTEWANRNSAEIRGFPEGWRVMLREELETRQSDLRELLASGEQRQNARGELEPVE